MALVHTTIYNKLFTPTTHHHHHPSRWYHHLGIIVHHLSSDCSPISVWKLRRDCFQRPVLSSNLWRKHLTTCHGNWICTKVADGKSLLRVEWAPRMMLYLPINSSPLFFHKECSHHFQYASPSLTPSPRTMKYYIQTIANAAPGSSKTSKLHKQCCQTHTCEPKIRRLEVNFSHREPFFGSKAGYTRFSRMQTSGIIVFDAKTLLQIEWAPQISYHPT